MKIAIIAAMEREVWPLVRNWKVRAIEQGGGRYQRVFENGEAVLICGGIGAAGGAAGDGGGDSGGAAGAGDLGGFCRSAGCDAASRGRWWSRVR